MQIYTLAPGQPFLTSLAEAILSGDLPCKDGPFAGDLAPAIEDLPRTTLILPTSRACRAMADAFLAAAKGRALLLPQIRAISQGDDVAGFIHGAGQGAGQSGGPGGGFGGTLDIPPAVGKMERHLVLTQLIMRWSQVQRAAFEAEGAATIDREPRQTKIATPAQASHLASELAGLMDTVETEGVSLAGLKQLVPDQFAAHWQHTLDFLRIVTDFWPLHLAERGFLSPADRRNRIIAREAERLAKAPANGPVIIAGVTGSIPATAGLMQTVAQLEQGAVVLPGLDLSLDEETWQAIAPDDAPENSHHAHPQFGLKRLLQRLGAERSDVRLLGGENAGSAAGSRIRFIGEAMRPPAMTAHWSGLAERLPAAEIKTVLEGVSLLEADSAEEEAEAVALILRKAVETPGLTAALVSPDRILARRVAIRLESWGLTVDDSAGRPLPKTVPGAFLDLVIEVYKQRFAPQAVMALLKHPLTRFGRKVREARSAARALELLAFRQPYLGDGLEGITAALDRSEEETGQRLHPAAARLGPDRASEARQLVAWLGEAYQPLNDLAETKGAVAPLSRFAEAHAKVAEAIAKPEPEATADDQPAEGKPRKEAAGLWEREAGELAWRIFVEIMNPNLPQPAIGAADYPDLYRSLVAKEAVRPRGPVHPRLSIWGPFEARLQQPDIIILGGLNEGTWPEHAEADAWLNRQMLAELGLPAPEEKIGHAAHDFTQLLSAKRVYLTRAAKIDGVPTVASRWLLRINALLNGLDLGEILRPPAGEDWLDWARHRDAILDLKPARVPEPVPPLSARPRRMSVTRVEAWIANPYSVFAREILRLEPLEKLGSEPDARLRGQMIHQALNRFARANPAGLTASLPTDSAEQLTALAEEVLAAYGAHPRVAAFWHPRFARFADWFAATEPARRDGITRIASEVKGEIILQGPAGPFRLSARADRIDLLHDGSARIYDYKTGSFPTDTKVADGKAPQLPLEAAMLAGGGFEGLPEALAQALVYISAKGGEPPGDEHPVKCPDIAALADAAVKGLEQLIASYDDQATPYRAVRRPGFEQAYRYDDYAHLARIKEWAGEAEDE